MELVTAVVGEIVIVTGRVLCGSIYSMINDTVKFQSNLDVLKEEMKDLLAVKDKLKKEKAGRSLVTNWLKEVEELRLKVDEIEAVKLSRWSLNCSKRYRISSDAAEKLKEIKRLLKAGKSHYSMPKAVEHILGPTIQDQPTSSKTLDQIRTLLSDDEVRRIGIWGMGGAGKTTLVRTLNNKPESISSKQPFGIVLWVPVSQDFDKKKVQTEIAERLKLETEMEESMRSLPDRIYERLKEEKFLLILDDVWEKIDLDNLGIPPPEDHKGSKIILTTRFMDVCRHMMTDRQVKVALLNEEESWQLFSTGNAGNEASSEHFRSVAKAIARECCGLPLALVTMRAAMRAKPKVEQWEYALHELQRPDSRPPDIVNNIYKPLKLSYDLLSKSIKPCFLYCSLFPKGFSIAISELTLYWLAEGLIDEKENHEDSFNRVINLIENLKDSCLLEDGAREGTVKMHKIVRDVAIYIASSNEDGCNSLIRSGIGLSKMSVDELSNSLKRVSFMNNEIKRLPDCVVKCSEVSTLLLQGNPLDRVPEEFLQGSEALRVLNMGGTRIHSLPLSLFQLGKLRALLLGGCSSLDELPRGLDELNRLEVLDLSATGIKELPRGMEKLSNLKQLNLSSTRYLETIQAGIISQLSCLEVLDMTRSKYCFSVKRDVQKKMACFDEELKCLERLLVLYIRLERIPCLSSEDLYWTRRLRRSQFFVGPKANSVPTRHDKRMTWSLSSLDLSSEREIESMLSNADSLDFVNCSGLSDMVINSGGCFDGLKSLTIQSCKNMVGRGGYANDDLLPNLEELYLRDLNYGVSISEVLGHLGLGHLGLGFLKLKLIQVEWCSEMEYLFSFAMPSLEAIKVRSCNKLGDLFSYVSVKNIPQELGSLKLIEVESCSEIEYLLSCAAPSLEEIKVGNCNKLGKLFKYLSVEDIPPRPVAPRLRILHLEWLPVLRTLCDDVEETWPLLEKVHVLKCDLVRKLPLTDENVKNIEEIKGTSRWWNALKWDADTTESRLRPFFHPYPFKNLGMRFLCDWGTVQYFFSPYECVYN